MWMCGWKVIFIKTKANTKAYEDDGYAFISLTTTDDRGCYERDGGIGRKEE